MDGDEDFIAKLSISATARAFADATLTPSRLLAAFLERIDRLDGEINAVVALDAGATAAAGEADARWASGHPLGPLDGVPYLVKDNLWTEGVVTTWGSRLFADFVPDRDEDTVGALRRAGAVMVGKTNVPEFADLGATHNLVYGRTRNPWNPRLSPGGSSGGSAAAVAAGLSTFALGTDAGGSIRRPSAHCGLVGFKPSPGRVPRGGGFPVWLRHLDVIGPIARSVPDLHAVMNVIAAWPSSLVTRPAFRRWAAGERTGDAAITVKLFTQMNDLPIDPRLVAATRRVGAVLAAGGHRVEPDELRIDLPALAELLGLQLTLGLGELAWSHPDYGALVEPAHAERIRRGSAMSALERSATAEAVDARYDTFRGDVLDLFGPAQVLMTPTTAAQAWDAMLDFPDVIDGRAAGPRDHAAFTAWVNVAGLPAVSLPMGVDDDGLPMGVQFIGRPGGDVALIGFAASVERALAEHGIWNGNRPEV